MLSTCSTPPRKQQRPEQWLVPACAAKPQEEQSADDETLAVPESRKGVRKEREGRPEGLGLGIYALNLRV